MSEGRDISVQRAVPGPDDVRAALDRALSSDGLRSAPQLSAFLTFVVERCLDGRSGELKGYTIATEALGRAPEFDPQSDPIVRVEAGRLRRALGQYYAYEGKDDPVRLSMPVGGYAPVFEFAEGVTPEPQPVAVEPGAPGGASRGWLAVAGLALGFGLVTLLLWYGGGERSLSPAGAALSPSIPKVGAVLPAPTPQSYLPIVAVTISESATDPALEDIARTFSRLLVDALARFDDLLVVRAQSPGLDPREGADYGFEMNAMRSGETVEGFGRLRSIRDGRIVWTTSTTRNLAGGAEDKVLAEIARRLAIRLAEPFGIIHADFRLIDASPDGRCLSQALNFRRSQKPDEHLAARNCLEAMVQRDPSFAPAWSQLALLVLDEHVSGLNPLPGPPLDRALAAAVTALRLAPSSARAQQVMMDVLFARGAIMEALRAGQEAMARNPYDPDIMADLGSRYVQLDRAAEGLPLLERAIELSNGRPPLYDFFAYLGARLSGDDKLAETHAAIFSADESPLSLLGRGLQCASSGDDVGMQASLRKLVEAEPLAGVDIQLYLGRKGFGAGVIDRLVSYLGPKGLAALAGR